MDIGFYADDTLRVVAWTTTYRTTTQVFRDPSAWYHLMIVIDTTQATANDRVKLYVNGTQVTVFTTTNNPTQNSDIGYNQAATTRIGSSSNAVANLFDGYLTEVNFIDGQALTPTSFGGYNSGTGVWEPRAYTGTYGTNGFYLNFQDNSNNTATTIGKDSSGNSNNWTPNGINVSAYTGTPPNNTSYDSMLDVPTNTSATNANYCTLNPLNGSGTFSNANLTHAGSSAAWYTAASTISIDASLNWYAEVTIVSNNVVSNGIQLGIIGSAQALSGNTSTLGSYATGYSWQSYVSGGSTNKFNNGTGTNYNSLATYTTNDIIGISLNNGVLTFYKNGVSQGTAFSGLTGSFFFAGSPYNGDTVAWNFGQRPFTYTPPTGFKSLNTYNLPDPTIPSGDDFHKVYTYTGNGGGLQVGEIQKPASLFNLDRSLRLRSSASAYLSRTIGTPTNSVKCTFSGWVKRGALGTTQIVFGGFTGTDADTQLYFSTTNKLTFASRITNVNGAAFEWAAESARVFNDPFQWLHIVVKVDTSTAQATNNDYYTVYVDGIAQTFTTVSGASLVSAATVQNRNTCWNVSGYTARLGTQRTTNYFDGYLADVYFIDGQALTPTDFGTYDGNFYWTPKAYTGTYGTNGFHLEFEDNSAATAAAIGKDTSGNVNNWTPNNISVTAGATYDSMTDVPTLTSTDAANFAVLDRLQPSSAGLSNGNLTATYAAASVNFKQISTIPVSTGKWYFEGNLASFSVGNAGNNRMLIGFKNIDVDTAIAFGWDTNGSTMGLGYRYVVAGTSVANVRYNTTTPVSTDIFAIEYDADAGTANFYKNGTLMGSVSGLNLGTAEAMIWRDGTSNAATWHLNFGQRGFAYTPSTGYKAINSFNIAEVTGDLESPDFVWIKSRSAATSHALFNSVTGVGKYLSSNATTAETTDVNSLIQFNKNGFLLGNAAIVNTSAATYVASAWKSGATTVTNTDGTISAQVRANQTAGFSIVTYTGTLTTTPGAGAMPTVGHGLGFVPKFIISKSTNVTGVDSGSWVVFTSALSTDSYLRLNTTAASASVSGGGGGTMVAPTNTVFSTPYISGSNVNANTYVAYCFAEIAGFSKFGSYTGNGSTDGVFVHLGFRPRWVMIKRTDATADWVILDTSRDPYNMAINYLVPNTSGAEAAGASVQLDFVSNGFKIRGTWVGMNASGGTYIYAAFAENPFKYSLAR
jgi:hypothetical protein